MTTGLRPRLAGAGDDESGMVTAFVVIFTLALLAMAGLVLDGGLALAAKVQAIDDAQAAARAGAQAIDIPLYRATGQVTLDPGEAVTIPDSSSPAPASRRRSSAVTTPAGRCRRPTWRWR